MVLEKGNRFRSRRLASTISYKVTVLPPAGCADRAACNYKANEACAFADCNGVCGGTAKKDVCGVCGGDGGSCAGCMDSVACNYDKNAKRTGQVKCVYAKTHFDCFSNCVVEKDCSGACGGRRVKDSCDVCDGDGTSCLVTTPHALVTSKKLAEEAINLLCPCNDTLVKNSVSRYCVAGVLSVCRSPSLSKQYWRMCASCKASYEDAEKTPWTGCAVDVLAIIGDHCSSSIPVHDFPPVVESENEHVLSDSKTTTSDSRSTNATDGVKEAAKLLCPCSGTMSADGVSHNCIKGVLKICQSSSLSHQFWQMCASCKASYEDPQTPWDSCAINVLRIVDGRCSRIQSVCTREFCSGHGVCSLDESANAAQDMRVCKCDAMYASSNCDTCNIPLRQYPDCNTSVSAEAAPINTNRAKVSVVWGLAGIKYSSRYEELTNPADGFKTRYNTQLDLNDPDAQLFLYDACFNISSQAHLVQQRLGSGQVLQLL